MSTTRRHFLDRLAVSAATLGAMPFALGPVASRLEAAAPATTLTSSTPWDLSWVPKLNGKRKAVFDVPEIESGYGVWRASVWAKQYHEVLDVPVADMSAAVILRHNAIVLAMNQEFWDRYGIGKAKGVTHPITVEPTDRNPVLLSSSRGEVPAPYDAFALDKFIARGGVALACDLALQDCVQLIQDAERVSPEEARGRALAFMVPGVILQPSGVFAAIRAQEVGCIYLRAS